MDRDQDRVFKALANPSRRHLLDRLRADNGQALGAVCAGLEMTRQAATKHLAVLEGANLVVTIRRGREKLHYLNPAPIVDIHDRWIGQYERHRVRALSDLKKALEEAHHE
ncbi:MAG TPA: helix-turn-helix domain-containing protein [bacterium]|nr:helix-turn-helix domain-containing protein [bacterium]